VVAGGVFAPLLLMEGVSETSAATGSLLLNLEGLAGMAIAWLVFRENVDGRLLAGAFFTGDDIEISYHVPVTPFENWTVDSIATHEVALHQGARLIRVGLAYNGVTSPISSNSEPPSSAKAELTNWPLPPRITKPPSLDEVKSWIRQRH
jgi:hypothetical protein